MYYTRCDEKSTWPHNRQKIYQIDGLDFEGHENQANPATLEASSPVGVAQCRVRRPKPTTNVIDISRITADIYKYFKNKAQKCGPKWGSKINPENRSQKQDLYQIWIATGF